MKPSRLVLAGRMLALAGLVVFAGCRGLGSYGRSSPQPEHYSATTEGAKPAPPEKPPGFFSRVGYAITHPFDPITAKEDKGAFVKDKDGTLRLDTSRAARAIEKRRQLYREGEELFRQENYSGAASKFKYLSRRAKDTADEEDALYMLAECYYKQEKLPQAQDTYAKLLIKYPTTRHLPQAVQRTYDIAYYWLEDSQLRSQGKPGKYNAFTRTVNLFDRTRPILDTNGRAIEAIEIIQQHDPFGPLTDDAAMMAGAHKFVKGDYVQAASYYEQISADQPKSEHATRSMVLGSQAYLRAYEGPAYEGHDLDNAEKLTKMALTRGVDLSPEQRLRLEQDQRVIYLEKAKRDFRTAEMYRTLRRPRASRFYFEQVIRDYPDTDWARRAEEEIKDLQVKASKPPGMLTRFDNWLKEITGKADPEAFSLSPTPADREKGVGRPENGPKNGAPRTLDRSLEGS